MIDPAYAQRVIDLLDRNVEIELVIFEGRHRHLTIVPVDNFRVEIEKWVRASCVDALSFKPDYQI